MNWLIPGRNAEEGEWISISDLMAGLMIIFLFIAISFIKPILQTNERIESIVVAWKGSEEDIYKALREEFRQDLQRWNAEIVKESLTVRFKGPDILFDQRKADLKPQFRAILDDFFPRYTAILRGFAGSIREIRIEGHTSSEWSDLVSTDGAYFLNMELSQERTRAVLQYVLLLPRIASNKDWLRALMTANGLSSSQVIRDKTGTEDPVRSRRVEFSIRTDAKEQMVRVIETIDATD
jgi:outer membrane protein OmpA-like peptidoglycan-associated protein